MEEKKDIYVSDFIDAFLELKNERADLFNNFNKDIIEKNIPLIAEKKYAITNETWNFDEEQNFRYLINFFNLLKSSAGEYAEDIEKLSEIFGKDISFSKQFTLDILKNEHKTIFDFARKNKLADDFISFISLFSAFPYREAVADYIKNKINLSDHISGFCPVCGHWPGVSYISKEGKKVMACVCCGTQWKFRRMMCSFCFTTDYNLLGYLNVDGENEISAYTCDKCRRYLKTKKAEDKETFSTKEIIYDYLCSGHIDIAALQNKYVQEPVLSTRFQGPLDSNINSYILKSLQ